MQLMDALSIHSGRLYVAYRRRPVGGGKFGAVLHLQPKRDDVHTAGGRVAERHWKRCACGQPRPSMQTPETLLNRGGQDGCQRILIVDDEQVIRDVVAETLVAEGYRVFAAADGADALGVVDRSGPFALILLDMRMPGMDGWTFAERYRHLPGPHAPVLVFTAGSAGDAADWVERIGAAGVLHKPFDLDELVAAVTARVGCPPEPVHVCRPRDARRFSQTGPADPTTALRAVGPRPTQLPQPALAGAAAPQERTP